jgi:hypothetical protein
LNAIGANLVHLAKVAGKNDLLLLLLLLLWMKMMMDRRRRAGSCVDSKGRQWSI